VCFAGILCVRAVDFDSGQGHSTEIRFKIGRNELCLNERVRFEKKLSSKFPENRFSAMGG